MLLDCHVMHALWGRWPDILWYGVIAFGHFGCGFHNVVESNKYYLPLSRIWVVLQTIYSRALEHVGIIGFFGCTLQVLESINYKNKVLVCTNYVTCTDNYECWSHGLEEILQLCLFTGKEPMWKPKWDMMARRLQPPYWKNVWRPLNVIIMRGCVNVTWFSYVCK